MRYLHLIFVFTTMPLGIKIAFKQHRDLGSLLEKDCKMFNKLFGGTMPILEKSLNLSELRHKLISSNIANEETPGYKAMDIDFGRELAKKLQGSGSTGSVAGGALPMSVTSPMHLLPGGGAGTGQRVSTEAVISRKDGGGLDGNTVNLEHEMVKMAENSVRHQTALKIINQRFQGLKGAIDERR